MRFTVIVAVILALMQGGQRNDKVQVVAVAQIKIIDAKRNTMLIGTPQSFPRGGGPGPGGRGGFPKGGPRGAQNDTKVTFSGKTLVREDSETIFVEDLKVGDSVKVTGHPRNRDIDATEIVRLRRAKK